MVLDSMFRKIPVKAFGVKVRLSRFLPYCKKTSGIEGIFSYQHKEYAYIFLGQLNTYLSVLDSYVRKPHENPSIGIILCREMNQTFVEFAVRDYNKPMGVATYRASEDMPERLRKALPDIEELKKLL